jgi:hypothetical protein
LLRLSSDHPQTCRPTVFIKQEQNLKTRFILAFLAILLASCAPALMPVPTETPAPSTPTYTPTPQGPTFTPTPEFTNILATVMPTQPPIPILTPDAIQIEKWKEYQTALAKVLLTGYNSALGNDPDLYKYALCEWELLGRSDQEVYVWAVCDGVSVPALIHLGTGGDIENVEVPGINSSWGSDIRRMFPVHVREKFNYYEFGRAREMSTHLEWRRTHPEEPPLIVLSATPAP